MAIALTLISAGDHVGPGYLCGLTGLALPADNGELAFVRVLGALGGDVCSASQIISPIGTAQVQFGVYRTSIHPVIGMLDYKALGDAVDIEVAHYDSGLALVEQQLFTGFLYDPSGGAWALQALILANFDRDGFGTVLDRIYDSVHRVYP